MSGNYFIFRIRKTMAPVKESNRTHRWKRTPVLPYTDRAKPFKRPSWVNPLSVQLCNTAVTTLYKSASNSHSIKHNNNNNVLINIIKLYESTRSVFNLWKIGESHQIEIKTVCFNLKVNWRKNQDRQKTGRYHYSDIFFKLKF